MKFIKSAVIGSFLLLMLTCIAYAGTIKGKIVFEGTPPPVEKVEVKSDVATCGHEKEINHLILGEGSGIANAVVIINDASGTPALKEGSLDQVKCQFDPHVQVLPVGTTLKITSSDAVLHNSHGFYEDGSTAFNIAVPIVGIDMPTQLNKAGIIKLRCDAGHTWMNAYIIVTDKPFYAMTDKDGNFVLENVPAGNYELEIWQEWLGKQTQTLEVKETDMTVTYTLKKST